MQYRIHLTDDTVEQLGAAMGEPIQELEQEILNKEAVIDEQGEQIDALEGQVDELEGQVDELEQTVQELQDEIDAFPEIEQLSVTENGTYSESGKAYSPVTVNVPPGAVINIGTAHFRVINQSSQDVLCVASGVSSTSQAVSVIADVKKVNANSNNDVYGSLVREGTKPCSVTLTIASGAGNTPLVWGTLPAGVTGSSISASAATVRIDLNTYVARTQIPVTIPADF